MQAMKYQPSANEKATRAAASNALPNLQPRIRRSQSANDAAAGVYGNYMPPDQPTDPRYYYSRSGAQTYGDSYAYDPQGYERYHLYAAEQAPNDEAAAYHQYHAQQARMKAQQAQAQQQLPPIYDNAAYNQPPGYYAHYGNSPPQHAHPSHKTVPPYDHTLYPPSYSSTKKKTNKKDGKSKAKDGAESDDLPTGPTKLQYAATVGAVRTPMNPISAYVQQSTDLRYELEQINNKKELKRAELETKRKALKDKNMLSNVASNDLEATKKKWNVEREDIIKSYGGKIPSFIIESDKLRKDLQNMSNRNSALQASLEVISNHLQSELYQLQYQLKIEKEIAQQTNEHNIELERRVRELRIEKLEIETELKTEKDKENDIQMQTQMANDGRFVNAANKDSHKFKEYPPESTVIQNLLQAQVEFYFSDYNLKRDKRLLSDVVKPPKKGFLKLPEILKLSRIRQLCSEIETLEEALRRSSILQLIREERKADTSEDKASSNGKSEEKASETKEEKANTEQKTEAKCDIWVGRLHFEKPREKEFPFRRTVFIFGIPINESNEFLHEMLKPFGTVSKIQFDHSPDGIDRKIGIRFLNKPRVYILYKSMGINGQNNGHGMDDELMSGNNREQMIFKTSYDMEDIKRQNGSAKSKEKEKEESAPKDEIMNVKCHKCGKDKSVSEGFYTTKRWSVIYCAQCAAQLAEDQLNVYYKERNIPQFQHNPRHKWLGSPPNDMQKRKTALVVFASQRQASKCAYVRTRIAYKGAFATHFHHYSKVKKEIVLTESDQNDKENSGKAGKGGSNANDGKKQKRSQSNSPNKSQGQNKNYNKQRRRQNNNRGGRGRGRGQNRNNNRGYNQNSQNQNMNNQYLNYAQKQAQFYANAQPPQMQQRNMKPPKIYRQSSAPTQR